MNPHLQRGLLLLEQSRYDQAEPEFRQALALDFHDAYTHALLALALAEQERFNEAEAQVAEALKLDPAHPFVHYIRAHVLFDRQRFPEATQAIAQAIHLDPEEADYRGLQAAIFGQQKKWTEALQAAEHGLALDPEDVTCTNFRAIALVQLGRGGEAGATIDRALSRNPENSVTHANQGWTLLHSGQHEKALEHFREALRLDPENEWARQGIVEALKAKNFIYAFMLKYFLWMSRLSPRTQWMVILGGYFGMKVLRSAAESNPSLTPVVTPLQFLYITFALLTWTAQPLFNLMLRLNRFGRMVLNREEVVASNWVGTFVGLALLCLGLSFAVSSDFLPGAIVFGFSVVPLAAVFNCQKGWPRLAMSLYTLVVAGAGIIALLVLLGQSTVDLGFSPAVQEGFYALFGFFFIGVLASGWIGNILMMQQVRK